MSSRDLFRETLENALMRSMAGEAVALRPPGQDDDISWQLIFQTEMDALTYELERKGYHIWFTCEVGGAEYRLAARTLDTRGE